MSKDTIFPKWKSNSTTPVAFMRERWVRRRKEELGTRRVIRKSRGDKNQNHLLCLSTHENERQKCMAINMTVLLHSFRVNNCIALLKTCYSASHGSHTHTHTHTYTQIKRHDQNVSLALGPCIKCTHLNHVLIEIPDTIAPFLLTSKSFP